MVDNLPVLRAKLGLSQQELGEMIGVSRQQIANYESRKRTLTWTSFLALVAVFSKDGQAHQLMRSLGISQDDGNDIDRIPDDGLLEATGGTSARRNVMFEVSYAGALNPEQIREMVKNELRQRGVPESVIANTPNIEMHSASSSNGLGGKLKVMWTEGETSPSYISIY